MLPVRCRGLQNPPTRPPTHSLEGLHAQVRAAGPGQQELRPAAHPAAYLLLRGCRDCHPGLGHRARLNPESCNPVLQGPSCCTPSSTWVPGAHPGAIPGRLPGSRSQGLGPTLKHAPRSSTGQPAAHLLLRRSRSNQDVRPNRGRPSLLPTTYERTPLPCRVLAPPVTWGPRCCAPCPHPAPVRASGRSAPPMLASPFCSPHPSMHARVDRPSIHARMCTVHARMCTVHASMHPRVLCMHACVRRRARSARWWTRARRRLPLHPCTHV
jgi:hypothetical protein